MHKLWICMDRRVLWIVREFFPSDLSFGAALTLRCRFCKNPYAKLSLLKQPYVYTHEYTYTHACIYIYIYIYIYKHKAKIQNKRCPFLDRQRLILVGMLQENGHALPGYNILKKFLWSYIKEKSFSFFGNATE